MSESEFWLLTPREFESLLTRLKMTRDASDYRTAAIICATYNVWRDSKSDPLTPDDVLGKRKKREQTPEEMLQSIEYIHASMGGKPVVR